MHREHRLGVSDANLVKRKLKLKPGNSGILYQAIEEIDHLYGIDSISFDERKRMLNMAYDATRLCIDGIENILGKHSIEIDQGWWNRFKKGHYRFVDQNIKDNLSSEPWSCH